MLPLASIVGNITCEKEGRPKEIEEAVHIAYCDERIGKLPNAPDTVVDERATIRNAPTHGLVRGKLAADSMPKQRRP